MWEFKLLDHFHAGINLSLHQAIMSIPHLTNKKFTLFHLIDKSRFETCHVLTVLKSAESYRCAMIVSLLPYLLWNFAGVIDTCKHLMISKWFKPTAHQQAKDAFWDPQEECIKNTSDLMLTLALDDDDALYWEQEENTSKSPQ